MANHRGVKLCKAKGQYPKNRMANVQMSWTVFTDLFHTSWLLSWHPLPLLQLWFCSTWSFITASRARQATMIVKTRLASPFIRQITHGKSWKITHFQKLVAKITKESFPWPYFYGILLSFLGEIFELVFYNRFEHCITRWKVPDYHHIVYLICISNARVLTKSVKIDQPEGIPDPGIPEWPFVKFAHRRSCASSCRAFFYFFVRCFLHCALTNWTPSRVLQALPRSQELWASRQGAPGRPATLSSM